MSLFFFGHNLERLSEKELAGETIDHLPLIVH